jgi:hypothetical protein
MTEDRDAQSPAPRAKPRRPLMLTATGLPLGRTVKFTSPCFWSEPSTKGACNGPQAYEPLAVARRQATTCRAVGIEGILPRNHRNLQFEIAGIW